RLTLRFGLALTLQSAMAINLRMKINQKSIRLPKTTRTRRSSSQKEKRKWSTRKRKVSTFQFGGTVWPRPSYVNPVFVRDGIIGATDGYEELCDEYSLLMDSRDKGLFLAALQTMTLNLLNITGLDLNRALGGRAPSNYALFKNVSALRYTSQTGLSSVPYIYGAISRAVTEVSEFVLPISPFNYTEWNVSSPIAQHELRAMAFFRAFADNRSFYLLDRWPAVTTVWPPNTKVQVPQHVIYLDALTAKLSDAMELQKADMGTVLDVRSWQNFVYLLQVFADDTFTPTFRRAINVSGVVPNMPGWDQELQMPLLGCARTYSYANRQIVVPAISGINDINRPFLRAITTLSLTDYMRGGLFLLELEGSRATIRDRSGGNAVFRPAADEIAQIGVGSHEYTTRQKDVSSGTIDRSVRNAHRRPNEPRGGGGGQDDDGKPPPKDKPSKKRKNRSKSEDADDKEDDASGSGSDGGDEDDEETRSSEEGSEDDEESDASAVKRIPLLDLGHLRHPPLLSGSGTNSSPARRLRARSQCPRSRLPEIRKNKGDEQFVRPNSKTPPSKRELICLSADRIDKEIDKMRVTLIDQYDDQLSVLATSMHEVTNGGGSLDEALKDIDASFKNVKDAPPALRAMERVSRSTIKQMQEEAKRIKAAADKANRSTKSLQADKKLVWGASLVVSGSKDFTERLDTIIKASEFIGQLPFNIDLISLFLNNNFCKLCAHQYIRRTLTAEINDDSENKCVFTPHVCNFDGISEVYALYRQGRIPDCIFSQLPNEREHPAPLPLAGQDHLYRQAPLDDQPLRELDDVPNWLRFYRCPVHNRLHTRVNLAALSRHDTLDRSQFKVFNTMFPFSSGGDKAHTNLDLATLLFQMYNDNHPGLNLINELLAISPLGRYNVWLTAVTILLIGTKQSQALVQLALSDGACCLSAKGTAKYFKAISTAIRRTQVFPDGTAASLEDISVWAYWELLIGRDGNKSDWEAEKRNRTTVIEMDSLESATLEQQAYSFLRKQFDALPQRPTDLQSWGPKTARIGGERQLRWVPIA
ncbi:Hypothetical protein FKW44_013329, partial [Caligus rogercresseyi]